MDNCQRYSSQEISTSHVQQGPQQELLLARPVAQHQGQRSVSRRVHLSSTCPGVHWGRLVAEIRRRGEQCAFRARLSGRGFASLLVRLFATCLLHRVQLACSAFSSCETLQCRRERGSCAVLVLAIILSQSIFVCTHLVKGQHLSNHLPAILERHSHPVVDLFGACQCRRTGNDGADRRGASTRNLCESTYVTGLEVSIELAYSCQPI